MRWLLNGILVLAGVPLVGTTLVVIGSFAPAMGDDLNWPVRVGLVVAWACSFGLFAFLYVMRTRWLERRGIYTSWADFEACVKESHSLPSLPEDGETDFFDWAGLSEERPVEFREAMKAVYSRIHAEIDSPEQRESYIRWLARYASPWPVHDEVWDNGE